MTTTLLPPFTGVRLAWAIAARFSKEEQTQLSADISEQVLKSIQDQAASDPKENQYVREAVATIEASLRGLDIVYKGRQLNFEENEKLRKAFMENAKENIEFGTKARDYLKSLPTMAITGAGTAIPFGNLVASWFSVPSEYTTAFLWAFGLGAAGAGHLIYTGVIRAMRKETQMHYVQQDYERNLYYEQYVSRVSAILTSLYLDLDRIHRNVFGDPYPVSEGDAASIVADVLKGVRPTMCKYAHKHIEKIITPALWALCESGGDPAKQCVHWEG
jgi:hypothetical protein